MLAVVRAGFAIGMGAAGSHYKRFVDHAKVKTDEFIDDKTMKLVTKILTKVGDSVKSGLVPPHLPTWLEPHVVTCSEVLWTALETDLKRSIELKVTRSNSVGEFREMRVLFWASKFPRGWKPNVLRARILYALYPGDANIWKSLSEDPMALPLLLVRLCPFWGISIAFFCLKFFLIDRSDEFQLVNYILEFKKFQFLSAGLLVGVQLGYLMASCVMLENAGANNACLDAAPGTSTASVFTICLEPVRIVMCYAAAFLLMTDQATGGSGALIALENRRLDAADGSVDGTVDREYLRSLRKQDTALEDEEGLSMQEQSLQDLDMRDALEAHRHEQYAQVRHGGYLAYFLIYDIVILLLAALLWAMLLSLDYIEVPGLSLGSRSTDDAEVAHSRAFWAMLYYTKFTVAILAFPFLAFSLPVVGPALHMAIPTAYDKTGALVPKLTSGLLREKILEEERDETEAAAGAPGTAKSKSAAAGTASSEPASDAACSSTDMYV